VCACVLVCVCVCLDCRGGVCATHCNALQHSAIHMTIRCNTLQHAANPYDNTLQHTATRYCCCGVCADTWLKARPLSWQTNKQTNQQTNKQMQTSAMLWVPPPRVLWRAKSWLPRNYRGEYSHVTKFKLTPLWRLIIAVVNQAIKRLWRCWKWVVSTVWVTALISRENGSFRFQVN